MFLRNLFLYSIKTTNSKLHLTRFINTDYNHGSAELSFRQKIWFLSKQKYENHHHILYSSYLEFQDKQDGLIKKKIKRRSSEQSVNRSVSEIGKNWMNDYEYYSGSKEDELDREHNFGTADANTPPSNIPCNGCGAPLHCNNSKSPGYLPSEIFKGRTKNELKTIICQRCHFLRNYNVVTDLEVTPESYIKTISSITDKFALAIVVIDLLDFPCSIWPDMHELLGRKRPVFIVGNKVDILPRDCNSYLDHIKECLKKEVLKSGFDMLNIKNISLISAKTGYGIEELITQLHNIWAYKGDVYLLGCTNVGKSSLFNILLNSDYSRPESTELIRKATTSPWPGTTLHMLKFPIFRPSEIRIYKRFRRLSSEKLLKAEEEKLRSRAARKFGNITDAIPVGTVGRTPVQRINDVDDIFAMSKGTQPIITLNENSKEYKKVRWVFDTPGVFHPEQITNLLTPQELEELQPNQMISPRSYRLKPGMSLYVAGLSRLDFIKSDPSDLDWIQIFVFSSLNLPTMIVETGYAADIYDRYLNSPLMKIPMGNEERLRKWPGLQCHSDELILKGKCLKPENREMNCSGDITLSSSGWVGLNIPVDVYCTFRAWTPNARGIYLRTPSLIPYAGRLIGKRIRNSLAYNTSKPFVFKK